MTIAEVIRDSPAGQIGRLYLGLKIAPYEDERESYDLSRPPTQQTPAAAPPAAAAENGGEMTEPSDVEKDDPSEKDSEGRETPEADVENAATAEPAPAKPKFDPNDVHWIGDHDRDNPQNWSTVRKTFVFAQICLLTFAIYSASAIITPAEGVFEEMWGVSAEVSALVLSMYVLGYVSQTVMLDSRRLLTCSRELVH